MAFKWGNTAPGVGPNGQYMPGQQGALSIIGQTMQGIAAPFAGDYSYGLRLQQLQQQQQQQDFQNYMAQQQLGIQRRDQIAQRDYQKKTVALQKEELRMKQRQMDLDNSTALETKTSALEMEVADFAKKYKTPEEAAKALPAKMKDLGKKYSAVFGDEESVGLVAEGMLQSVFEKRAESKQKSDALKKFWFGQVPGSRQHPGMISKIPSMMGQMLNPMTAGDFYQQKFQNWMNNR